MLPVRCCPLQRFQPSDLSRWLAGESSPSTQGRARCGRDRPEEPSSPAFCGIFALWHFVSYSGGVCGIIVATGRIRKEAYEQVHESHVPEICDCRRRRAVRCCRCRVRGRPDGPTRLAVPRLQGRVRRTDRRDRRAGQRRDRRQPASQRAQARREACARVLGKGRRMVPDGRRAGVAQHRQPRLSRGDAGREQVRGAPRAVRGVRRARAPGGRRGRRAEGDGGAVLPHGPPAGGRDRRRARRRSISASARGRARRRRSWRSR